ncbi:hypothetical protein CHS0354_034631 [Potamilus streckersoni]|uniref:TRPM-like domain-containing protein n=1 Tax=Potamilus streckersoni TaxID=2493646 RepID=A0AAE0TD57_9BIVA|nr:hypothetical protein CHS0354_034631 [Potamilus streckersoni]
MKAKNHPNKNQVIDHLGLALTWGKIEIARNDLLIEDTEWPTDKLEDIMLLAIVMNSVDFVELFLEAKLIDLKEFLTIKRLLLLYNNPSQTRQKLFLDSLFRDTGQEKDKDQSNKTITLKMVGKLMTYLLGDYYDSHYISEEKYANAKLNLGIKKCSRCKKLVENSLANVSREPTPSEANNDSTKQTCDFDNPQRELFIWSVLNNQREMAEFFWQDGKNAIAAALVAHALLFAMSRRTHSKELIEQYTSNAK